MNDNSARVVLHYAFYAYGFSCLDVKVPSEFVNSTNACKLIPCAFAVVTSGPLLGLCTARTGH